MADTTFVIVITLIGIGGAMGLVGLIIRGVRQILDRKARIAAATAAVPAGLREDVDFLRDRVTQLEERVDFTERLLAQAREREQLGPRA